MQSILLMAVLILILLGPSAAVATDVLCQTQGTTLVAVSEATLAKAVHFWLYDKAALRVLIDREQVGFLTPGLDWYVPLRADGTAPMGSSPVRLVGSPDTLWAFASDFGCPTPAMTPAPADLSPPTSPPTKAKRP
jgi:hypothetical protein